LVSGPGGPDTISITLRNGGKLPIRRMEFNCTPIGAAARPNQRTPCREDNAPFSPGLEYELSLSGWETAIRDVLGKEHHAF